MQAPHALTAREVASELDSRADDGLPEEEAQTRLRRFGPNRLERAARPAYAWIALRQFVDPLVALLVGAAIVSALIGDGLEASAIGAIIILNAVLGFAQEVGAERAVLELRESLERQASVVRDGRERQVPVEEVVPGDVVVLAEGERVPADARLISARGLATDESLLTGESVPADKAADPVPEAAPLAERTSMVYAGTGVTRGPGLAIVTATADATELGQIAGLASRAKPPPTPLQRRIRGLARVMVAFGVGVTLMLGGAMLLQGETLHQAFLVGVSVAIAAVPEGLAATVTIALALGARAMAERGAIVRRLTAVETLGSATVVASDKTGTLTENRLGLAALRPAAGKNERELLTAAVLASAARLLEEDGSVRVAGDPVDGALVLAAHERGLSRTLLLESRRLVDELPFDAERKRMTLVYEEADGRRAYVKGAPEVIHDRSVGDTPGRDHLQRLAEKWAGEGLRVLAVAHRSLPEGVAGDEVERELHLAGLVALEDPLREHAASAVAEARSAGLRIEILTGDHPATARAIGHALSIPEASVHARITPADKLRLVEQRQDEGEVVAVTGDGVNDSPALRRADIGVAMGRSGSEAAREAADIVLTDDDFATIIAAIREGRSIADNIRKFVAFLLSANLGEVLLFAIVVLAGLGIPMTVVQVLLVNVLTDGLPAVALTRDPSSPFTMRRPPDRSRRLFPPIIWAALGAVGVLVGLAALGAFMVGHTDGTARGQTMAFATIALAELVLVYAMRSYLLPAWHAPCNRYLAFSVIGSAAIVAAALYLPALHEPLGTVSLDARELALVALFALVPLVGAEAGKLLLARAGWGPEPGAPRRPSRG